MMTEGKKAKKALLLVDDDSTFLSVMRRAFERLDFDVQTASDDEQAILLAEKFSFDKAIVDLKLENTSGLSLIPKLKAVSPNINIIVLTGYSSVSTAVEAIKLGARNYLCKPASSDEILKAFDSTAGNENIEIAASPPSVNRLEWEHIQKVLHELDGNVSATARALGMHRRTLQRKLQKRPVKT